MMLDEMGEDEEEGLELIVPCLVAVVLSRPAMAVSTCAVPCHAIVIPTSTVHLLCWSPYRSLVLYSTHAEAQAGICAPIDIDSNRIEQHVMIPTSGSEMPATSCLDVPSSHHALSSRSSLAIRSSRKF